MDFEIEEYDTQNDCYILNILPEPVIKLSKKAKEYVPSFVTSQNKTKDNSQGIMQEISIKGNNKELGLNTNFSKDLKRRQMSYNYNNENNKYSKLLQYY